MDGVSIISFEQFKEMVNVNSIDEVIIYGSRAKGNYKEGSDIDLTLLGNVTKEDFNKLWQRLDDSYIPYKFDLSVYNYLK